LHGAAYTVASSPDADCIDLMDYWHARGLPLLVAGERQAAPISGLELGQGEKVGRMMILAFLLQAADSNPLLRSLPRMIHLQGSASGMFPWMNSMLEFLVSEDTANRAGYVATAAHLSNLIFTSFIRAHALSVPGESSGWLQGLADRRIRQALVSMHARPGEHWTTESLAEEAGMSRHTFGRRFTRLVGQSPIDYLIDLRMQVAAEHLRAGNPVARVAEAVGYQSERAFREVFRRRFGVPPLRYSKA
jgi:AraC-like DNA-binding protein